MRALNIGCGRRFHPAWTNIDLIGRPPEVLSCDITNGLPFADNSFDAAYHSHVLEHLDTEEGARLLGECFRVLAPGGILRIAVPDLEQISRTYMQKLEAGLAGDATAARECEWMRLELTDQLTRERSGGGMIAFLRAHPELEHFIMERLGEEARAMFASVRKTPSSKKNIHGVLRDLKKGSRRMVLGSQWNEALAIGEFRKSGEVHRTMYDRLRLAEALKAAGFIGPEQQTANQSHIPDWQTFHLDALEDGTVIKPDSLFMEAQKPARSGA